MNEAERRQATIDAFRELDPVSLGGIALSDVAERVALKDNAFMLRFKLLSVLGRVVGRQRNPEDVGIIYESHMYPTAGNLERAGIIVSEWDHTEPAVKPRNRVYRYIGTDQEV